MISALVTQSGIVQVLIGKSWTPDDIEYTSCTIDNYNSNRTKAFCDTISEFNGVI